MIRLLGTVAILFLLAAGFAWLAERPGALVLTWQGYEIRTSMMVAAIAFAVVVGLIALVGAILRALVTTPQTVGHFLGARRRDRGYRALTRGMIAVGAGDVRAARRAAQESQNLLGREPLVLLLSAQAAQIAGDGAAARTAFEALSTESATRVLGLHGLFVEARRQGEHTAARHFAEEAMRIAPRTAWAGTALFEYQSRAGDWQAALSTFAANADGKIVERERAKRLRAVLDTARAMELEAGDPDEARALALEAQKLAPDLVPAALSAARLFARSGDIRRASRLLESTWKLAPHPEVADAYAAVRPGDSAVDRLKRVRHLASLRANHPEGALALARAAIDARDWQAARNALGGTMRANPTERVCLLMAIAARASAIAPSGWLARSREMAHPLQPVDGGIAGPHRGIGVGDLRMRRDLPRRLEQRGCAADVAAPREEPRGRPPRARDRARACAPRAPAPAPRPGRPPRAPSPARYRGRREPPRAFASTIFPSALAASVDSAPASRRPGTGIRRAPCRPSRRAARCASLLRRNGAPPRARPAAAPRRKGRGGRGRVCRWSADSASKAVRAAAPSPAICAACAESRSTSGSWPSRSAIPAPPAARRAHRRRRPRSCRASAPGSRGRGAARRENGRATAAW